jgi:tetratricopeptide (TPR) repeat protein
MGGSILASAPKNETTGEVTLLDEDKSLVTSLFSLAVSEAKLATTLAPTNYVTWTNLATVYQSLVGVASDAHTWTVAAYQKALTLNPISPNLRIDFGGIYMNVKDYDQAIALEPKQYSYYLGKYYLLTERGDTAAAEEVLAKAAGIEAKTGEDEYQLAKVHYYQGDYDNALSELNKSFADGFQEAYYYIGEIYRIKKDYQKAIYYYENYIKGGNLLSPNAYNQIAVCEMKIGEYEAALNYLEKGSSFRYAGTQKTLLRNEIIAYERLGNYQKSKEKIEEYLSLYPDDEVALKEAAFIDTRLMDVVIPEEE